MKTAYELAMERLNKAAPLKQLSNAQKKRIAELDSVYAAKIAEKEIALKAEAARARAGGDLEAGDKWMQQLAAERQSLEAELEHKKESIRQER